MVDGFHGLIHDPIIRRDNEDNNICHLRPPGPHGRESFVTRCIQKDNIAIFDMNMIGADSLGNPSGLTIDNIGLPNGVQKGCFAMIHMSHDRDDWRPGSEIFGRCLYFLNWFLIFGRGRFNLVSEFAGNEHRRVKINGLVDGCHQTQPDQLGNHFARLDPHFFCQFTDRNGFSHSDSPFDRFRNGDFRLFHFGDGGFSFLFPFGGPIFSFKRVKSTFFIKNLFYQYLFANRQFISDEHLDRRFCSFFLWFFDFFASGWSQLRRNEIFDNFEFRSFWDFLFILCQAFFHFLRSSSPSRCRFKGFFFCLSF